MKGRGVDNLLDLTAGVYAVYVGRTWVKPPVLLWVKSGMKYLGILIML